MRNTKRVIYGKIIIMRFSIVLAFALLVGCSKTQSLRISASPVSGTLPVPPNPAYVMVITGQSNAYSGGQNRSSGFTSAVNGTKHFDSTAQSFLTYTNSTIFSTGFETQAGGSQFTFRGDTIYMVRVAQTSLPISDWAAPNGFMWVNLQRNLDSTFSKLRAMGKTPVVLSTIWLQGEQDININSTQAYYQNALSTFIDNYMAIDPILLNKQFVMVKIRSDQAFSANDEALVNTSFDNMVSARNYCNVIDPVAIGATFANGDLAHYSTASYMLIANAWNGIIP